MLLETCNIIERSHQINSIFRTESWVQAWIDTWGNHKGLELIDLGGNKNPLEYLYKTRTSILNLLPIDTLALAGTPYNHISTPRSEYNSIKPLVELAGSIQLLQRELAKLDWHQIFIPDILTNSETHSHINELLQTGSLKLYKTHEEPAYSVKPIQFEEYLKQLGSNTRSTYFNKRNRLRKHGEIDLISYPLQQADYFFSLLNDFHKERWHQPCYSAESLSFFQNFLERITTEGGKPQLQSIAVNGEIVSVLFDISWQGTRYNLQSGYKENKFPKISLGSIHLGYAIEEALNINCHYDFLAGTGKNNNYKAHISNEIKMIQSHTIEKPFTHLLRKCKNTLQNIRSTHKS